MKEQITRLYEGITVDPRITPVHIGMYMALLLPYLLLANENPIQVDRDDLMQNAKISARSTYYKSLQELHEFGYIKFISSYNLYMRSLVYLKKT